MDRLFYIGVWTRTLLTIAAMGSTDVRDLCSTVGGIDHRTVWNAANHWQREGLVRSVIVGRRRAVELDPAFVAASELKQFLLSLMRLHDEHLAHSWPLSPGPKGARPRTLREGCSPCHC